MRKHRVIKRRTEWKMLVIPIIIVTALIWFSYSMINMPSAEERYKDMEYTITIAKRGDTLWSIARDNYDNSRDIREVLYCIKRLNSFNSDVIYPGQVIRVPIYR